MVIELETGARADGTLVARKARLVLDKGAYCGEGGFFAQMAAMHALGPYELENVHVESSLVYSNNQPSSSIRAPTAPQVCWALEQHMDELAEALGMDPVDLRRHTLIETGSVTATGQVLEQIAMKETLEKAVELIGYGQELPDDEAIGVSVGWWPCFASPSGAYVKLNPDGTGTIITGAQENGTGAVMAMPQVRGRAARHAAGGLLAPLPGHRRGAVRHGLVRLADDLQQRPRRDRRRRRPARAAARRGRGAARGARRTISSSRDGAVLVKGSPDKSITIAKLAGGGPSTARAPARCRTRPRRSPPRAASGGSGSSRSTRRS